MARKPMVTRTLQSTTVTALCMDIASAEPCNRTLTIPRTYKSEKDIMKVVKPILETDAIRVVAIVDTAVNEALYGMTEQEFLEYAHLMPPRSTADEEITTPEEG